MNKTTYALLTIVAATLTACGGGGSGDEGTSSPVVPTAPAVPTTPGEPLPADIALPSTPSGPASVAPVANIPAATYPAGSDAATAFALVNAERSKCGFGRVAQNAQLDVAATAHSEYVKARIMEGVRDSRHSEDPTKSGFTGVTPADRAIAAGYSTGAGENIAYYGLGITSDHGTSLVRALMATVYHLANMVDSNREVGVGVAYANNPDYPTALLTWTNGTAAGVGRQEPVEVLTYPCDGSAGVQPYMFGEFPDPFISLGFPAGENVGHPIYVRAPVGQVIQLLSATVISSTGQSVPVMLYHATQDSNKMLAANQAFVVPREALAEQATYTVQVQGIANGIAFARAFSFSTLKF